jgi:hypothetical protein
MTWVELAVPGIPIPKTPTEAALSPAWGVFGTSTPAYVPEIDVEVVG